MLDCHVAASQQSLFRRALPFAALLACVCMSQWSALLGQVQYWGDMLLYFIPQQAAIREALLNEHLPLWNPGLNCGQPLMGNPQASVLYPTTLLLPWMSVPAYFTLNTALHLWLAAAGAYLWIFRACKDRIAAVVGGVLWYFLGPSPRVVVSSG